MAFLVPAVCRDVAMTVSWAGGGESHGNVPRIPLAINETQRHDVTDEVLIENVGQHGPVDGRHAIGA
jgi:hypothetical protein